MDVLTKVLICIAGLINFLPVMGALSRTRIEALYGISVEDSNLEILMRHRAILFGIVGTLMIASAFDPSLRSVGYIAGFTTLVAFILIVISVGNYNANLRRVVIVDLVGIAALSGAFIIDHCL